MLSSYPKASVRPGIAELKPWPRSYQSNNGRAYKGRKRTSVPFTFMEQTFPLWNT